MKTTVEISDNLAREVRKLAVEENTSLRALIEAGLRLVLEERREHPPFRLRDASFGGKGLQPEFREVDWEQIREEIYGRERGG